MLASTPNSRFILSTNTSKWSSPIPDITVWPDSWSVSALNVGSSSANFWSAVDIFSWSPLLFGSIAIEITGSGITIFSKITSCFSSHKVSPVVVFLSPTAAAISPANTSCISVRLLACICKIRPILSLTPLFALRTYEPLFSVPEYTRKNDNLPTNGSVIILNAKAENGSLSDACLNTSWSFSSWPLIDGISVGAGK